MTLRTPFLWLFLRLHLSVILCLVPVGLQAESRVLIIAGLGGEPQYQLAFDEQAQRIHAGLSGISSDVQLLTGPAASSEMISKAITGLANRSEREDTLILILIGHGSYDDQIFRFNIPGPDITDHQLKNWLDDIPVRHQLVVATGSSSGALLNSLQADKRTLMTATRSGDQRDATVFGTFFADAMSELSADTDKDQIISANEAFEFASAGVDAYYRAQNQMPSEHPQSEGTEAVMMFARLNPEPITNPALQALYKRRESLELTIVSLRKNKAALTQDDYFAQLQRLLLEMALVEEELAAQEPGSQSIETP